MNRGPSGLALGLALALAGGCGDPDPTFRRDAGPADGTPDAPTARDAATADTAVADAPAPDLRTDTPAPDLRTDTLASDGSADATASDATAGDGATDAAVDGSPADLATDGPSLDGFSTDTATDGSGDGAVSDGTASDGTASDGGGLSYELDGVRPTVTVEQGSGQDDPTQATPLVFDVTFSEPIDVATIAGSDFVISPDYPVVRQIVDLGDHQHFELRLTPVLDGNYYAELPAARVADLHGDLNETSTGRDRWVQYNNPQPTVLIRPLIAASAVNALPLRYQVFFFRAMDPATFDTGDLVNAGSASGITWQLIESSAGRLYELRASAISGEGTVLPQIPAGAVQTSGAAGNLASVYLGEPISYTTLPILRIVDAEAAEGETATFYVRLQGTAGGPVLFDWTTADDTALAGVDYVAAGASDVVLSSAAIGSPLPVALTPDDDLPEDHKRFFAELSNVRGDVFVDRATAVGTVENDDRGTARWYANTGSYALPSPRKLRIHADDVQLLGTDHNHDAALSRHDRVSGALQSSGPVLNNATGAGLTLDDSGYYLASNDSLDGFELRKHDHSNAIVGSFGTLGKLAVHEGGHALWIDDLVGDGTDIYLVGRRTVSASGDAAWYLARRAGDSGAPVAGFGSGGLLLVDQLSGAGDEGAFRAATDGTALFVLGQSAGSWRVEKRALADGALVGGFAAGGLLALSDPGQTLALHQGTLYLLGRGPGDSRLTAFDAGSGAWLWTVASPMAEPEAITVDDSGVYIGGGKDQAWHLERRELADGTLVWAQTDLRDRAPSRLTTMELDGTHWIHGAGHLTFDAAQHWYIERRSIHDGFRYSHAPGSPLE